jgi:uncharacterized membrane protein
MATFVNWTGEAYIMLLDVPINYLLKAWSIGMVGAWGRPVAMALGALQYYYYGYVIKGSGLVLNSNAWDALSALATTAMGVLIFGETLTERQWLGTSLIIAGLALL